MNNFPFLVWKSISTTGHFHPASCNVHLILIGSLGFDIKGVWNGGISHTQERVHSVLIWMSVKWFPLINNGSRLLLCLDLGNETSRIHRWLNESLCVLQKLAEKTAEILVCWYCKVTWHAYMQVAGKVMWGRIAHLPSFVCQCKCKWLLST